MLAAGLVLAFAVPRLFAADPAGKPTTITGKMVCGKCTLHLTKDCQDVVQVTKDGKTVNYFLTMNDTGKNAHDPICDAGKSEKVTVTGTLATVDGKLTLTPSKIDVLK